LTFAGGPSARRESRRRPAARLGLGSGTLASGREFRTANLEDDCTRECPAILVDFSLPGRRVTLMLDDVARERGYTAKRTDCRACPLEPQCTKAAARHVTRLLDDAALGRVSTHLAAAPELMQQRAQTVEPAFATRERWMHGGGRFLLRGKAKATTEIKLVNLACNLERLITIHGSKRLLEALA
jgi:hypothetical protein